MYRHITFIALGFLAISTPLQSQSLVDSGQQLPGTQAGKATWGDYDNDGDADLCLIGEIVDSDGQCRRIAQIFLNNAGILSEDLNQRNQLIGVYFGDLAWGDYDNDGDLDLAIVGWDVQGQESLRLYRNTESGTSPGTRVLELDREQIDESGASTLTGVRYATLAWGDYDGDGDLDLAVAGMGENGASLTQLYLNSNGVLHLNEINSETLINLHNGALTWIDYDNDGDLDLAMTGENTTITGGLGAVTEFYQNNPVGTLDLDNTLRVSTSIKGGDLAWADYDNDGNLDLAVAGREGLVDSRVLGVRERGELVGDARRAATAAAATAASSSKEVGDVPTGWPLYTALAEADRAAEEALRAGERVKCSSSMPCWIINMLGR